jgi:hypothetical protein
MNFKLSTFFVAMITILAIFACKNDKVTSTGKPLGDEKSEKFAAGMPIYENMQGNWVDRNNPSRKLNIAGGHFKLTENGQVTTDAEFVFYKNCPGGCFPADMSGTTPCFSLRTDKDLRCFVIQGIQHAQSIAFAEIASDSLRTQFFDWAQ